MLQCWGLQALFLQEKQLQQEIANRFTAVALMIAPYVSATASLVIRSLSGTGFAPWA